jgi:hypothetical protein
MATIILMVESLFKSTRHMDTDYEVSVTSYFMNKTGERELPPPLKNLLSDLGFTYNAEEGSYYYSNPSGDSVPDEFKAKTMGAIIKVIQQSYSDL